MNLKMAGYIKKSDKIKDQREKCPLFPAAVSVIVARRSYRKSL